MPIKMLLAAFALLALGACNTVQGAGKDISSAGAIVSDEAEDAQQGL